MEKYLSITSIDQENLTDTPIQNAISNLKNAANILSKNKIIAP